MVALGYAFGVLGWICSLLTIFIYYKRTKKKNLVYLVKGFWFMEIFTMFFSTLVIIFIREGESVDELFLAFIGLGIACIVSWYFGAIEYDRTGFVAFNFILQKKRYEYKDVRWIKTRTREYRHGRKERITTICFPKRIFWIEQEYMNYFEFMEAMEKAYKADHKKKIPRK